MPHFLVLLYDGTDAGAPARRQAARDAHLGQLKEKVASGKVVFGGRIFDDAQQPIGSFMIAHCADRTELDAIIASDPYTTGKVWQNIDVKPAQIVVQNGNITA